MCKILSTYIFFCNIELNFLNIHLWKIIKLQFLYKYLEYYWVKLKKKHGKYIVVSLIFRLKYWNEYMFIYVITNFILFFLQLDAFYRSSSLSLWYDYVEVDAFNPGSVIVSYILSLSYIEADLDTLDLKQRMNDDLGRLTNHLGNFTVDPKGTDFIGILIFLIITIFL